MTGPLQVLVLEDRPADAELAVRQLERADYAVDWQRVETLGDFRARLTPNLDLILADYSLPGFTVVDALAELRGAGLDVPVVVVSGTVGDERAVECLKLGATDYILKDRMARLGPAVGRALAERANRRETRRAQEALVASEQQMRTILSTVEDVVWSMAPHTGRIVYVSPAVEKVFGRPAAAFLQTPSLWAEVIHPGDRMAAEEARQSAIRWGTAAETYRIQRPDGTIRHTHVRYWCTHGPDKKPVGLQGISTDITDRVTQQAEHRALEESRRDAHRLKELNEVRTQFTNMMVHELNNPLTPMKIQISLLTGELAAGLSEAQSKSLAILARSTNRLAGLLQDLLDASRLQAGRLTLNVASVDLAPTVRTAIETYAAQAETLGSKLTADLPATAMSELDLRRMEQVVNNLLSNALKFTPAGGTVTVALTQTDKEVQLVVRDSGRGLAPEEIGRLFQPFSQLPGAPQGKHTGTGLGLFICKGIVEGHGGRVSCQSEGLGKGSAFTVTLPRLMPSPK